MVLCYSPCKRLCRRQCEMFGIDKCDEEICPELCNGVWCGDDVSYGEEDAPAMEDCLKAMVKKFRKNILIPYIDNLCAPACQGQGKTCMTTCKRCCRRVNCNADMNLKSCFSV